MLKSLVYYAWRDGGDTSASVFVLSFSVVVVVVVVVVAIIVVVCDTE